MEIVPLLCYNEKKCTIQDLFIYDEQRRRNTGCACGIMNGQEPDTDKKAERIKTERI